MGGYVQQLDNVPFLNKEDTTYVQQVVELFLCYARALDFTMLLALKRLVPNNHNQ